MAEIQWCIFWGRVVAMLCSVQLEMKGLLISDGVDRNNRGNITTFT